MPSVTLLVMSLNSVAAVLDDVVGDGYVMHDVPGSASALVHRAYQHDFAPLPAGVPDVVEHILVDRDERAVLELKIVLDYVLHADVAVVQERAHESGLEK